VFSFTNVAYPSAGYTSTLSPSSSVTGGTGTATTTWTPSNDALAPDNTHITTTIGTSAILGTTADLVTTIAGAPSKVTFYFENPAAPSATDYLGNRSVIGSTLYAQSIIAGTSEIALALSDAFGNPVGFGAVTQIVLAGVGGQFDQSGVLQTTLTGTPGGSGAGHFSITGAPSPMPLSFVPSTTYVQSSGYGAIGELSATVTSGGVQYTGSSGQLVTSALGTLSSVTTNPTPSAQAGNSITVMDFLNTGIANYYQLGVPITLNLCTSPCATTSHYDGKFTSNGAASITLTSNSTGGVEATMPANTTVGNVAIFNASAPAPTNAASTHMLTGAASASVTTVPGAISTLVVNIAAGTGLGTSGPNLKDVVNGTTAYVSVAYADAFGNLVTTAPANQIQIALAASAGALSATQVYIAAHDLSTNATTPTVGFGSILWTLPNTVGTTATITGSGNVNGKAVQGTGSVMTVSAYPTINVTSPKPVSGVLYAPSTFVTFQGFANATIGSASTNIVTVGYKVGTGGWLSISTAVQHNPLWTVPLVLVNGINTVQFNVTDSAGKTTVSPAYQVLVDSSVPTFGTLAVVNGTSTAKVNVTAAQGDLNASSVSATANGTAVAASSISVSGTNNNAHSVTYVVSVNNLAKGTWTLVVSAKTLAGLSGSVTATVTVASSSTGGTPGSFSFPSTPKYYKLSVYNTVNVTVTNTQASSLTAIVFAVFHNSAGQTLQVSTSSVTVPAGSTATAFVPTTLASGTYSVNVFVWSTTGSSLSSSEQITVTF